MRLPDLHLGRGGAAALALAVVAVAVVVVVSGTSGSPGGGAGAGTGSTASGSATVQRRNLVARDTESGTLSYAGSQTVYNRLSGTVTWLPGVGSVIRPGQTLFTVDNRPVLLMDGRTPAFRDLTASDLSGPDVDELNRNLVKLGYNPDGIVVDGTWQSATTAGVDALQLHLGETETGALTLGQVVFLPGPQLIAAQTGAVGATAAGYHRGGMRGARPPFVDYPKAASTTTTTTTGTTTTPTTTGTTTTPTTTTTTPASGTGGESLQALIALLKAETTELQRAIAAAKGSPGTGGGAPHSSSGSRATGSGSPSNPSAGNGGGGGGSATTILQTSSTKLVVTVDLNASLQGEAKLREPVTVELPDGRYVGGRVSAISAVAQSSPDTGAGNSPAGSSPGGSSPGGATSPTVPVTITLDRPARGAGLDQASVSVNFAQAKAEHVLSVPVTALLARSGNSFAVQQAAAPHRLIPITTGLFAAGFVQISGSGIYPGLRVTDSQG